MSEPIQDSINSSKKTDGLKRMKPWFLTILFVVFIPFFPEYVAPILAAASLVAARCDAKACNREIKVGTLGKLIVLYMVYMACGLLYTRHFLSTLSTVAMWAVMFLVYLAITTVLTNRHRLRVALFSICLIAGSIGLIGCLEYVTRGFLGWNVSLQFWWFLDKIVLDWFPVTLLPMTTSLRVSSTFNNPNIFAEYLVMVIPFIAYYSFNGQHGKGRLVARLCLLVSIVGVSLTFSRGCYLALLMIAVVFCIANIRNSMLVIVLATSVLLIPEKIYSRLFSISSSDASVSERMHIWASGTKAIGDNPLFGVGAGVSNTWEILLDNGINAPHMHNMALQLLAEGGIIALAIMVAVGWRMFRIGFELIHHTKESRMIGIALLAFAAAFSMDSLVDFPLLTPKLVGVYLMVLALGDSIAKIYLSREMQPVRDLVSVSKWLARLRGLPFFKNYGNSNG